MRWLFIILLLFNIVYFGWEFDRQIKLDAEYTTPSQHIPADSQRLMLLTEHDNPSQLLKSNVQIEVVEVQAPQQTFAATAPGANDDGNELPDSASQLVAELPEFNLSALRESSKGMLCYTFGPVAEELLAVGLSDWFKSRRAWSKIRYIDEKARQLFWVYLAPQESKKVAMKTIQELKNKGISDYRFINKGNLQNAISLGLFSSQAAVNSRLRELAKKGYNPVVVPYFNSKRVYWVDVKFSKDLDISDQLISGYPSRYTSIPVDCDKVAN